MDGYADWIGPAMTPESPPSAAPKAKTRGEHAVDVDPEARRHLGVEDAGADDRAQRACARSGARAATASASPNTMTKSR